VIDSPSPLPLGTSPLKCPFDDEFQLTLCDPKRNNHAAVSRDDFTNHGLMGLKLADKVQNARQASASSIGHELALNAKEKVMDPADAARVLFKPAGFGHHRRTFQEALKLMKTLPGAVYSFLHWQ